MPVLCERTSVRQSHGRGRVVTFEPWIETGRNQAAWDPNLTLAFY